MNEDVAKKIFIYCFVIGALLFSIWKLSEQTHFMVTSQPAAVEVTRYNHTRSRAQNNTSRANVVFYIPNGAFKGKGHSMQIFSFFRLHKVGTVASGRYSPKSEIAMTNKYGWALVIFHLVLVFISIFMIWGVIKYGDNM